MAVRPNILAILKSEGGPTADLALLTALEEVDAPTAQEIVGLLLLRKQKAGLTGLIERFHEFDDPICRNILEHVDELFGALRIASQSKNEQVRLNTLEIIRRGYAYRAAYLVDAALRDRAARVREAAAETLYALADQLLKTSPIPELDSGKLGPDQTRTLTADLEEHIEDRRQVIGAIEGGLSCYGMHLQPKTIEVAMWFVDELGQKFWAVVSVPGSRPAHAAISAVSGVKSARLVPFCMIAMHYSALRAPVAKALGSCVDTAFIEEWVRQSWRLVEPKIGRAMAGIKELAVLSNRAAELAELAPSVQRHLPRWVGVTGLPGTTKLDFARQFYRRGDRQQRRAAVLSLLSQSDERTASLLRAISRDSDEESAIIARFELALRYPLDYPPSELLEKREQFEAQPGDAWGRPGSKLTFEQYWAAFDDMSEDQRREKGRRVIDGDATAVQLLARQLAALDAADRLKAVRMVAVLGLGERFIEHVYRLSHDTQPEVRSAAVAVLGQVPGPVSKRLLKRALQDGDTRVQANAVEAVERTGDPDIVTELLPMLASPDNRVRANAVKALLKLGVREAALALLRMLDSPDRTQRISALWLIDHMGLFTLASRVMRLAECDQDKVVRSRAKNLTDHITTRVPVVAGK